MGLNEWMVRPCIGWTAFPEPSSKNTIPPLHTSFRISLNYNWCGAPKVGGRGDFKRVRKLEPLLSQNGQAWSRAVFSIPQFIFPNLRGYLRFFPPPKEPAGAGIVKSTTDKSIVPPNNYLPADEINPPTLQLCAYVCIMYVCFFL